MPAQLAGLFLGLHRHNSWASIVQVLVHDRMGVPAVLHRGSREAAVTLHANIPKGRRCSAEIL